MDIIEALKAVLFGIVEGITEWLPISSTGHMMLLEAFVPLDGLDQFRAETEGALGAGSCHVLSIRPVGGCVVCP